MLKGHESMEGFESGDSSLKQTCQRTLSKTFLGEGGVDACGKARWSSRGSGLSEEEQRVPCQCRPLTSVLDNSGKAQANEQRYSKLKEKYNELVQNHADLLRKVGPSPPPAACPTCTGPPAQGRCRPWLCCFSRASVPTISWKPELPGSHISSSTLGTCPTCDSPHLYHFCNT